MATVITIKGQVTIPKTVRDQLKLHSGDRVEFVVEKDGTARLVPLITSVKELKGLVPRPERKLKLDEFDEVIARGESGT